MQLALFQRFFGQIPSVVNTFQGGGYFKNWIALLGLKINNLIINNFYYSFYTLNLYIILIKIIFLLCSLNFKLMSFVKNRNITFITFILCHPFHLYYNPLTLKTIAVILHPVWSKTLNRIKKRNHIKNINNFIHFTLW